MAYRRNAGKLLGSVAPIAADAQYSSCERSPMPRESSDTSTLLKSSTHSQARSCIPRTPYAFVMPSAVEAARAPRVM